MTASPEYEANELWRVVGELEELSLIAEERLFVDAHFHIRKLIAEVVAKIDAGRADKANQ